MRVLLVDNYDSFTYNLLQALEELGAEVDVRRNDAMTPAEALSGGFDRIVVSPGPGTPERAGVSVAMVREAGPRIPTLGVCLGHQAIAVAFGGRWVHAPSLVHGKTSPVRHEGKGVFAGLPSPFEAARYHSLVVDAASLPPCLEPTAWAGGPGSEGPAGEPVLMGMRHRELPIEGVQFHPESFMTLVGKALLSNFLKGGDPG